MGYQKDADCLCSKVYQIENYSEVEIKNIIEHYSFEYLDEVIDTPFRVEFIYLQGDRYNGNKTTEPLEAIVFYSKYTEEPDWDSGDYEKPDYETNMLIDNVDVKIKMFDVSNKHCFEVLDDIRIILHLNK